MTTEQNKSPPTHSPGPWAYDAYLPEHASFYGPEVRGKSSPDYDFRVEFSDHVPSSERISTCEMIAAAPELFSALDRLVQAIHFTIQEGNLKAEADLSHEMNAAHTAIAKARGQQ